MTSTSSDEKTISVQVVYALPQAQHLVNLQVKCDSKVVDAVKLSGLAEQFPELQAGTLQLGVFGKIIAPDTILEEGMRVEIYRPLILDPKESRRQRARLAKKPR